MFTQLVEWFHVKYLLSIFTADCLCHTVQMEILLGIRMRRICLMQKNIRKYASRYLLLSRTIFSHVDCLLVGPVPYGPCSITARIRIFRLPPGWTSTTWLVVWGRDHRNCAHAIIYYSLHLLSTYMLAQCQAWCDVEVLEGNTRLHPHPDLSHPDWILISPCQLYK